METLDQGIYTIAEVSRYARVNANTVRSWFEPRSDGRGKGPIFKSTYGRVDGDFSIGFLNLIEASVARFFKTSGCTSQHIRKVHKKLQAEWKIEHPFAHGDLRTDGERIIIANEDDPRLVDALSNQGLFENLEPLLLRIRYSQRTKLAEEWPIYRGVTLNPKVSFGKPVIDSTGVSTLLVANQFEANGRDAAVVARLFKITPEGVENAVRFEHSLRRAA